MHPEPWVVKIVIYLKSVELLEQIWKMNSVPNSAHGQGHFEMKRPRI